MRKVFILCLVGLGVTGQVWGYDIHTTYCANNGYSCAWCLGGGSTHSSDCVAAYAGCGNKDATNIAVGSSIGGLRCTSSGFCYDTCPVQWVTHPTIEHLEIQRLCSGCKCSSCSNTDVTRCASGYEMIDGVCVIKCEGYSELVNGKCEPYCEANMYRAGVECVPCPSVTMANNGVERPGFRDYYTPSLITNCYIRVGNYTDEKGTYQVRTSKCPWVEDELIPTPPVPIE